MYNCNENLQEKSLGGQDLFTERKDQKKMKFCAQLFYLLKATYFKFVFNIPFNEIELICNSIKKSDFQLSVPVIFCLALNLATEPALAEGGAGWIC